MEALLKDIVVHYNGSIDAIDGMPSTIPNDIRQVIINYLEKIVKEDVKFLRIDEIVNVLKMVGGEAKTNRYRVVIDGGNVTVELYYRLLINPISRERIEKRQYYVGYKLSLPSLGDSWNGIFYEPVVQCVEADFGSPRHPLVCSKYLVLYIRNVVNTIELAVPRIAVDYKNWRQVECFGCIEEGGDVIITIRLPGLGKFRVAGHCVNRDGIMSCWSYKKYIDVEDA